MTDLIQVEEHIMGWWATLYLDSSHWSCGGDYGFPDKESAMEAASELSSRLGDIQVVCGDKDIGE